MTDTDGGIEAAPDHDDGDVTRRWLIRALVGLGFGIPLAIEGATLVGLLQDGLLGGGDDDGDGTTPTTSSEPTVGVGDELLPATEPADTLTDAVVSAREDDWRFELAAAVENTTDRPYELRVGDVTTQAGTRVDGGTTSGRVQPGDTGRLEAAYELPVGETPASVSVVGVTYVDDDVGGGGGQRVTQRTVRFRDVTVRG